jgi:hypothetical protein
MKNQTLSQVEVPITKTIIIEQLRQFGGIVYIDHAQSKINATNLATVAGLKRHIIGDPQWRCAMAIRFYYSSSRVGAATRDVCGL